MLKNAPSIVSSHASSSMPIRNVDCSTNRGRRLCWRFVCVSLERTYSMCGYVVFTLCLSNKVINVIPVCRESSTPPTPPQTPPVGLRHEADSHVTPVHTDISNQAPPQSNSGPINASDTSCAPGQSERERITQKAVVGDPADSHHRQSSADSCCTGRAGEEMVGRNTIDPIPDSLNGHSATPQARD